MKANWQTPWCRPVLALLVAGVAALALHLTHASGQTTTFNEREVKSEASPLDDPKLDVWALDFRFKDPRLIKVHVPGRGTRICWYLWYQVINRTKEPRLFIPDFELVTLDPPAVYHDEILPSVQEAIKKIEDPTGYQKIRNSVTIAAELIPMSRPAGEAFPQAITGVAIWDGSPGDEKPRDAKSRSTRATSVSSRRRSGFTGHRRSPSPPRCLACSRCRRPHLRRPPVNSAPQRIGYHPGFW